MTENRADSFLRMIRRAQRGRLKVYLGYCAGVGKTYRMLQDGHQLKQEGIDVVIGLLETHGRVDVARLAEGLEVVPRRRQEYRGLVVEEMDLDAILARKPQVALVDELAHTNAPNSRNHKRYEDVQDLLAAGIHVISTLNLQHLESLYDVVERAVGVKVRERLPDSVLAEADQIVDVDLSTEDLRTRLAEGKIYPPDRIETAAANFFTASNLAKLRELTLRELASQIDLRQREVAQEDSVAAPDQVMVGLSSRGPQSEKLLRYASRLAGKLNRNWYAVYVQTPSEEATVVDAQTQRAISETLTLAKQLGAMVFTYKGEDVADTLLRFAQEYRVGHIVVGTPGPRPFWIRLGRSRDVTRNLIRSARGVTIIILDTRQPQEPGRSLEQLSGERVQASGLGEPPSSRAAGQALQSMEMGGTSSRASAGPFGSPSDIWRFLSPRGIVIWDDPVPKEAVLKNLSEKAGENVQSGGFAKVFAEVMKREEQGSTFFNEGAAFPHVRLRGLSEPIVTLGVTKGGVSDIFTERPIRLVFLILSPDQNPDTQVRMLALASRAAQDRHLVRTLLSARTPEEVMFLMQSPQTHG